MLIRYPLGFQISQNSDENKVSRKKAGARSAPRKFWRFQGKLGGYPLENRRAKRAAKILVFPNEKKGVPPCFPAGHAAVHRESEQRISAPPVL